MMIKSAFLVFMGTVFALPVGAAICVEDNVQKCAELGYTQESCKYGGVACPYDKSKFYCAKWKCQDGRYFPTGTAPNINQEAVTTTYKDMECVDLIDVKCDVGNVYYHDGTCGLAANYDGSKIPVGIVFATSPNYNWGKIVSINNLALKNRAYFDVNSPYSSSEAMYWGLSGYKSTSLTNFTLADLNKAVINENYEAIDGFNNTILISDETSSNTVCTNGSLSANSEDYAKQCVPSAFLVALAYYPHSTLSTNNVVGAGKWYVPSMYEAMQLYGYNFNNVNIDNNKSGALRDVLNKVNSSLSVLRAKGVNALTISGNNLVSNELGLSTAFSLNFDEGTRAVYNKSDVANLRVIAQWSNYTCEDGGYSTSRASTADKKVVAVKYKNLTCYTFEDL